MKWLDVGPKRERGIFHFLRDLIESAPKRMRGSFWRVDAFREPSGDYEFDVTGNRLGERLEHLKRSGERFGFEALLSLAEEDGQIIWASFFGYDAPDADDPWIVMSAVDSSFWRFDTNDVSVRNWVRSTFSNVRIGQP